MIEPATGGQGQPHRALRILIVEDCDDAAATLAVLLRLSGHEIVVAKNGPQGVALAMSMAPHVVFLDIGLPGLDGYKVAKAIRESKAAISPLIVVVSGYGNDEDRQRAAEAGVDLHFVKPADPDLILRILREHQPPLSDA